MSGLFKNIFFAVIFAGVLWLGYKVFFAQDDASLSAQDSLVISQASRDTQEFLTTLQQLRGITLDNAIFTDARLQSFVDHRQAIVPEPTGRHDPFAPLGR